MTDDFDGADLLDCAGEKVGSIERTYVDDDGQARFLGVKRGTLRPTHQLVPADAMQETECGIQVPYEKSTIESSPSIETGDTLEGDALREVRAYYAGSASNEHDDGEETNDADGDSGANEVSPVSPIPSDPLSAAVAGEGGQDVRPTNDPTERRQDESTGTDEGVPTRIGEIRDLGDVLEVPIVEEVLVRKPVVREVLRVRKTVQTSTVTAEDDLRREDVEVDSDSKDSSTGETA